MKTTTNYGFKQPEGTDIVNIDDISDNFGSVDTEIKKANDKVLAHEGKGGTVHADVTTTTSGFMSAADKTKLNGIATGAQTNQNAVQSIQVVTPTGTVVGTATAANTTDTIQLKEGNNIDIAVSGKVVTVNNTYSYTHPTGDGNLHVPTTGTSNSGKVLKAGTTAGSLTWATLTPTDIGLSNLTNDSQVKRSEMGVANGISTLDANGANKQPPASHASTSTTYGVADTSNYGHVRIGDGITVSSGIISTDIGTGLTLEGTSPNKKIALANSGVTAGTYKQVTIDAKGRVTGGNNPSTLAEYGITDAAPAGFGLGDVAVIITGTNLNNVYKCGFYRGENLANAPTSLAGDYWYIQVISATNLYVSQIAHCYKGDKIYLSYKRDCINGVWTAWKRFILEGDIGYMGDAKWISSIDLNTVKSSGMYRIYNCTNSPDEGFGNAFMIVIGDAVSSCTQIINSFGEGSEARTAIRSCNTNSWSDWNIGSFVDNMGYLKNDISVPYTKKIRGLTKNDENVSLLRTSYSNLSENQLLVGDKPLTTYLMGADNPIWYDGTTSHKLLHSESNIQQYPLTRSNGVSKVMTDIDFNDVLESGAYVVSNSSGMTNAPYTGGIWGTLFVQKRAADDTSTAQIFIATGSSLWCRHKDVGSWSTWKRIAMYDDMQGNGNSNGFQRFPNGNIIQWGYITGVTGGTGKAVNFPIAFPNAVNSIQITQYGGSSSYTDMKVDGQNKTSFYTWCNSASAGLTFYYMAIGY